MADVLQREFRSLLSVLEKDMQQNKSDLIERETGIIQSIGDGIARIKGLTSIGYQEQVEFPNGVRGMVFDLDEEVASVILFDRDLSLKAGQEVTGIPQEMDVPVGETLLGRIINPLGKPLDGKGPLKNHERGFIEGQAPEIMDRLPVSEPLQSGLAMIDALIPVGKGQRELILGDRQTGKTSIAVDTIINQKDSGIISIYCAIGQRLSAVERVVETLERNGAMENTILVVAGGEDSTGLNYIAPYAATAMAEYFAYRGKDALIVYDDLTNHARSYRELSLLMRRPPAREAYPGDIFYIHSRLLERSTHLNEDKGGGSLTALPIIATEAENISAYIPTNLISITDGQIYLSPGLFQEGILPAVDVGRSVSRVGGKAQLKSYRTVAGDLRLSYSQFIELENFARFETRLDEDTRKTIEHGKRVREIFKQPRSSPLSSAQQIVLLYSASQGVFDSLSLEDTADAASRLNQRVAESVKEDYSFIERIEAGEELSQQDREQIEALTREVIDGTDTQAEEED